MAGKVNRGGTPQHGGLATRLVTSDLYQISPTRERGTVVAAHRRLFGE